MDFQKRTFDSILVIFLKDFKDFLELKVFESKDFKDFLELKVFELKDLFPEKRIHE